MYYLSAQDAAGNIWSGHYIIDPGLAQKLLDLSLLDVDLTYPESLDDEELIAAHEFLGSIFHNRVWGQMHANASQLPIPGGNFDFYCVERVYLAIARHAYSRTWEHSPKHADWIDGFKSMTTTGGYVPILQANDSYSYSDPAFEGSLDAPTWYGVGSCWKPANPNVLAIESMPRVDFILARLSNCKYE